MGKTTIDGLAVRTPSDSGRKVTPVRGSLNNTLDVTMRKPARTRARMAEQGHDFVRPVMALPASIDSRQQRAMAEDFLEPVGSFGFSEEDDYGGVDLPQDNGLGMDDGADWSDLLGELNVTRDDNTSDKVGQDEDWLAEWGGEEDEQIEEEPKRRRRDHKKRKKPSVKRVIIISVLLVLVVGIGAVYAWGDDLISRLTGGKSGLFGAIWSMVSEEVPFDMDANGRTNVLIFGTGGYDMAGSSGGGTHDGAPLTDSIMVISADQNTKDVALISLPRDLKVPTACMSGKLNEVFWCGSNSGTDEEAGAQALMKQIGEVLGIEFQYYAHVNWSSLIDIVDTIGGITVTLDEDINDYGHTGMVAKAGVPIDLNGAQALGLARARYGTVGGDFTRGNSQQKIVEAIVAKVVSGNLGASEAFGLLNILGDNLRSNFSTDNIKAGMRLVSGFDASSIRQIPLVDYTNHIYYVESRTINDISFVVPAAGDGNYDSIQDYVSAMLSNDEVARENAKLEVYNATGERGVAAAERSRLEEAGFTVLRVDDANGDSCSEKYCVYVMNPDLTATKTALEERYGVVAQPAESLPGGIWPNGADFVIVIGLTREAV